MTELVKKIMVKINAINKIITFNRFLFFRLCLGVTISIINEIKRVKKTKAQLSLSRNTQFNALSISEALLHEMMVKHNKHTKFSIAVSRNLVSMEVTISIKMIEIAFKLFYLQ